MKLTFCTLNGTVQFEITPEHFKNLRDPSITHHEIIALANHYGVESKLLLHYVNDLKLDAKVSEEIDGSCEYSDHI
jgi:hypothetical protein